MLVRTLLLNSLLCTSLILAALPRAAAAVDWLPDMIVRESDLYNHDISTVVVPGRVHLRLANGTANIGLGPLYIFGGDPDSTNSTQDVLQRIFADDASFYD
jgi:hypothetical protein